MSTQNLARLGELITLRRAQLGMTGTAHLAAASGIGKRTIDGWLAGESEPQAVNRARLEGALGWRAGSIADLLASPDPEAVTLESMTAATPEPKATRASELTDDELFLEVTHRLRDWRSAAEAPETWAPTRADLGLAADSTPEDKGEEPEAPDEV